MNKLISVPIEQFGGMEIKCTCGKTHTVQTKYVRMKSGAINDFIEILLEKIPAGKLLLVTSKDAYASAACKVESLLRENGYMISTHIYDNYMCPDMKAGGVLFNYPEDVRMVVAIGGGSVVDVARYFASVAMVEYVVIPSAPTSDGFLASTSPLYVNGFREIFVAKAPYAVIIDMDYILACPRRLVASGFGELVCKLISLFDWYFAYAVSGEEFCQQIYDFVMDSVDKCLNVSEGLVRLEALSIAQLMESLTKCAVAIQILGGSRANAGGEHQVANAIEMLAIANGENDLLHGERVFLSAKKLADIYELFVRNKLNDLSYPPDNAMRAEKLAELLGLNFYDVLEKVCKNVEKEKYNSWMYRFDEYRDDLVSMISSSNAKLKNAYKIFKRIYEDLGESVLKNFDGRDFKAALSIAADVDEKFTCLTLMREIGLLDTYLR